MSSNGRLNRELLGFVRNLWREKQAFVPGPAAGGPPPGGPMGPGPMGPPPGDPGMGGMPPIDPSMLMGMMGGPPPGGPPAPPADPAMQAPPAQPPADQAAQPAQPARAGGKKNDMEIIKQMLYALQKQVAAIMNALNLSIPPDAVIVPPEGQEAADQSGMSEPLQPPVQSQPEPKTAQQVLDYHQAIRNIIERWQ